MEGEVGDFEGRGRGDRYRVGVRGVGKTIVFGIATSVDLVTLSFFFLGCLSLAGSSGITDSVFSTVNRSRCMALIVETIVFALMVAVVMEVQ